MARRKLTKDELAIMQKQSKRLEEQKNIVEGDIKNSNFKLDFQLQHNYDKLKMSLKNELKQFKKTLSEIEFGLKTIQDQVDNGVEVKKK